MKYISVSEAAQRFGVSKRYIQKLCKMGRIESAHMLDGMWLIPENAQKPEDRRISDYDKSSDLISLGQLCSELSISLITGKNWLRLNKITYQILIEKTPYFSKEYVKKLKHEIKSGKKKYLRHRRNKKFVSGNQLYHSYISSSSQNHSAVAELLELINKNKIKINRDEISILLCHYAICLIMQKHNWNDSGFDVDKDGNLTNVNKNRFKDKLLIQAYIDGELDLGEFYVLVDTLLVNTELAKEFISLNPALFEIPLVYEEGEDLLGFIYISISDVFMRKAKGAYYTPDVVVKSAIDMIFSKNEYIADQTVLDPCCGTGNFLLKLLQVPHIPKGISPECVYGFDIDDISVYLTRINLALKCNLDTFDILFKNIVKLDFLSDKNISNFDFIIGNPPWAYEFSSHDIDKLVDRYQVIDMRKSRGFIESYSLFVEAALNKLNKNGVLSFILPESILNVKVHTQIRKIILDKALVQYIEFLGDIFPNVQCPSLILQLIRTEQDFSYVGTEVKLYSKSFMINIPRKVNRYFDDDVFRFHLDDREFQILNRIYSLDNLVFLERNAHFGLGIVTGNNANYISFEPSALNEPILKGVDIKKYRCTPPKQYIISDGNFQQMADLKLYRTKCKLLYRFISKQLIFAYDESGSLSLNSCNILIPNLDGLDIKYILALLNSRILQFTFQKMFHSIKVLKSHISKLPIPNLDRASQREIIRLVESLIKGELSVSQKLKIYDELDAKIANLYHLNTMDYEYIKCNSYFDQKLIT